jgi:hypothetical protein
MGSPDPNSSYLVSGRLAYGCTNLSTAWPHGGTGLGLVGEVNVFPQSLSDPLLQEETNSASEVLWLGGDVVVSFTAHNWDVAALAFLFPNSSASNGHTVVDWPGTDVTAGAPTTTYTNVVFTPRNSEHPGFVIYKAAPLPAANESLVFSAYKWLEVPGVILALPDGSDRLGKMGKFSELTL